jgi:hypothetical protein
MSSDNNARKTRSPLKEKSLREPGDSLYAAADKLVMDTLLPWLFIAALFVIWAVLEWYRYLTSLQPSPWLFTICAAVAVIIAVRKRIRIKKLVDKIGLGFEGERVVGQSLEYLRADGYQVFHDIAEDGYNIDHVVIGPKGVYAIETKTRRKGIGHAAEIVYDGKTLLVDGHSPDRNPLKQAQASADRISEILRQNTGHNVYVRPVVLYPGWWVTRRCRNEKVWVLNPNALPDWLQHENETLPSEQIQLYSTAVANHVRSRA